MARHGYMQPYRVCAHINYPTWTWTYSNWTYHWGRFLFGEGAMMRGNGFANHASAIHVSRWACRGRKREKMHFSCLLAWSGTLWTSVRRVGKLTAPPHNGAATWSLICVPHRCAKTIESRRPKSPTPQPLLEDSALFGSTILTLCSVILEACYSLISWQLRTFLFMPMMHERRVGH